MINIKLFITDIDGVWTDGGMYYDNTGNEWKKFNTSDSAGVLFLRLLGIPTAIITGEQTQIVARRAEKLGIQHLYMGVKHKLPVAISLCQELGIELHEVAFIGDDINDIKLLQQVGLSAAPSNAPNYVKEYVHLVVPVKGGDGAFRAFVETYLEQADLMKKVLSMYLEQKTSLEQ
jgi:YrbI family 3-deoxy-D-manno-octulosonate 8-phosphate phosphatase